MSNFEFPFIREHVTGGELRNVERLLASSVGGARGEFSALCRQLIGDRLGGAHVILTPSCSSALEVAALVSQVGPGDEVILPSFTFSSTANAFAARGATLVFVDVTPATFLLDPGAVARAVTPRTRVIVPVHYAGVSCDMDELRELAEPSGILLVEDAAHAYGARHGGQPVGSRGDLAAFSFHRSKNVSCGEGGALAVHRPDLVERAEIAADKGTDRRRFLAGVVDSYTWVDIGTSAQMSELSAAVLAAQLGAADETNAQRVAAWRAYRSALQPLLEEGLISGLAEVPDDAQPNGHLFFMLASSRAARDRIIGDLREQGVSAPFHYTPLHLSEAGRRHGRWVGDMTNTMRATSQLIRLPLWPGIERHVPEIAGRVARVVRATTPPLAGG